MSNMEYYNRTSNSETDHSSRHSQGLISLASSSQGGGGLDGLYRRTTICSNPFFIINQAAIEKSRKLNFSGDINEENNVIRLHLRRTERVLNANEIKYFNVSLFLSENRRP